MELTKLLVRTNEKWIHLCYIESDLLQKFLGATKKSLNEYITLWCKEDFNVDFEVTTPEDLYHLKAMIKEHYKKTYPEVVLDAKTDRQGWTRVWVTNKMKEEVENGKERQ